MGGNEWNTQGKDGISCKNCTLKLLIIHKKEEEICFHSFTVCTTLVCENIIN